MMKVSSSFPALPPSCLSYVILLFLLSSLPLPAQLHESAFLASDKQFCYFQLLDGCPVLHAVLVSVLLPDCSVVMVPIRPPFQKVKSHSPQTLKKAKEHRAKVVQQAENKPVPLLQKIFICTIVTLE